VVAVPAAVEDALLDPGGLGALRQQLAGPLGLVHASEGLEVALDPVHRRQRVALDVVDQLRLDPAVAPEDRQPRPRRGAVDLGPHAPAAAQA
jgi:hypothetical protein